MTVSLNIFVVSLSDTVHTNQKLFNIRDRKIIIITYFPFDDFQKLSVLEECRNLVYSISHTLHAICIHLKFKIKIKLKKEQQGHSFLRISIQQLHHLIVEH